MNVSSLYELSKYGECYSFSDLCISTRSLYIRSTFSFYSRKVFIVITDSSCLLYAGLPPGLNKYRPRKVADVIKWDFISKAWFSDTDPNPKRRIDSYSKEGLNDVIREVNIVLPST